MSGEEPPFLPVGTEVSAKYRGAFCEAKVKKVMKYVKCKVTLKDTSTHLVVTDEEIRGPIKNGMPVQVRHPDTGEYVDAVLNKVVDSSTYGVVFNDGDENTLRRTQLCLKGEKHFVKSETLDQLPLTHPEHFGTPVMQPGKRRRKITGTPGSETDSEESDSEDSSPKRREYKARLQDMIGRIVCIEVEDRKKTMWVPVLVIDPNASDLPLKTKEHLLVRSFKDSKYYAVTRKETKEFARDMAVNNEDKTLKNAFEKTLAFFDSKELPSNWDRNELLGSDTSDADDESSDDEPSEEKDMFVAQLYKFMDDRGTPLNKAPVIGNRDLSLYKLFRVVHKLGGYNKVTNLMKWKQVYSKMNLPPSASAATHIKAAYKKYLHAFEDFYRKLGSSMGTISRPGRNRHNSGRSLLSFRERESPRSPRPEKKVTKDEKKEEEPESGTQEQQESKESAKDEQNKQEEKKPEEKKEVESDNDHVRKGRSSSRQTEEQKEEKEPERKEPATKRITREDMARLARDEGILSQTLKEEKLRREEKAREEKANKEAVKKTKEESKTRSKETPPAQETKSVKETKQTRQETKPTPEKDKDKDKDKEKEKEKEKEEEKEESPRQMPKRRRKRSLRLGDVEEDEEDDKQSATQQVASSSSEQGSETKSEDFEQEREDDQSSEEKPVVEREEPRVAKTRRRTLDEHAPGTKLKVKYGKGKNVKLYEAKVVELEVDSGSLYYLVHYAGWNHRYDEWITKERIVGVVEAASGSSNTTSIVSSLVSKSKLFKKKIIKTPRPPIPPLGSRGQGPPPGAKPLDAKPTLTRKTSSGSPSGTPSALATRSRLSRQASSDTGVPSPPRRRTRRNSGVTDDAASHVSAESESENSTKDGEAMSDVCEGSLGTSTPDPTLKEEEEEEEAEEEMTERSPSLEPAPTSPVPTTNKDTEQLDDADESLKEDEPPVLESVADMALPELEKAERSGEMTEKDLLAEETMDSLEDEQDEMIPGLNMSVEYITELMKQEEIDNDDDQKTAFGTTFEDLLSATPPAILREFDQSPCNEVEEESKPEIEEPPELDTPDAIQTTEAAEPAWEAVKTKGKKNEMPSKSKPQSAAFLETQFDEMPDLTNSAPESDDEKPMVIVEEPEVSQATDAPKTEIEPVEELKESDIKPEKTKSPKAEKKGEKSKAKAGSKVKSDKIIAEKESPELKLEGESEKKKPENEKKKTKKKVKKKEGKEAARMGSDVSSIERIIEEVASGADLLSTNSDDKDLLEEQKLHSEVSELTERPGIEPPTVMPTVGVSPGPSQPIMQAEMEPELDEAEVAAPVSPMLSHPEPPVLVASPAFSTVYEPQVSSPQPSVSSVAAPPKQEEEEQPQPTEPPPQEQEPVVAEEEPVVEPGVSSSSSAALLATATEALSMMQNTPPDTPEHSPQQLSPGGQSPNSEADKMEDIEEPSHSLVAPPAGIGGMSPTACDMSTISNSSSGSSGNVPSCESSGGEGSGSGSGSKRKQEADSDAPQPAKKKKRGHKRSGTGDKTKTANKRDMPTMSDSDEASNAEAAVANTMAAMSASVPAPLFMNSPPPGSTSPSKRPSGNSTPASTTSLPPRSPRPPKYNFNLEEGKYLEGEARINFLVDKIQDIRKIYLSLKGEVACIDRRRKRARRKEKEKHRTHSPQLEADS